MCMPAMRFGLFIAMISVAWRFEWALKCRLMAILSLVLLVTVGMPSVSRAQTCGSLNIESCPVATNPSYHEYCVGGVCTVSVECPFIGGDLCICGAEYVSADELICAPCSGTGGCGDGVCAPPEDYWSCPIDCSQVCVCGTERCNGNAVLVCNRNGMWNPLLPCGEGTVCRETTLGATCESGVSFGFYRDSDRDGFGDPDSTPVNASGSNLSPNNYDCDDSDPNYGPSCTEPLPPTPEPDCSEFIEPPDEFEVYEVSTLPGCSTADLSSCCPPGATVSVESTSSSCTITCTIDTEQISNVCFCGEDTADGLPDVMTCLVCTTACGDGVCDGPETATSCEPDCGAICDDGARRCNGFSREICSAGQWVAQACPSDQTCRREGDVIGCVTCDESNPPTWYLDGDEDGFGTTNSTYTGCYPPLGFAPVAGDTNDLVFGTNMPPVAIAQPDGDVIECAGPAGTPVSLDGTASFDADGDLLSYAWSPAAGLDDPTSPTPSGTYAPGSYSFTMTVDDGFDTDTDTASFAVVDTSDPSLVCEPGQAECTGALTAVTTSAAASDTCDGSLTATIDNAGPYSLGVTNVAWSATDAESNTETCQTTATVVDTLSPSIGTAAADMTVECGDIANAAALTAWLASNGGATASDICGGVTWSNNFTGLSDDCGDTGSATVTFTATDDSGRTASTTATFVIEDTTNPEIRCPSDIAVRSSAGQCELFVPFTIGRSDTCDASPLVTCTDQDGATVNPAGDTFPVGDTTTVTCTAEDCATNTDQCSFMIDVNDPPQITAINPVSQVVQYSDKIVPVVITATDCGPGPLTISATGVPSNLSLPVVADACNNVANGVECTFTLEGQVLVPSGDYDVVVTVTDDEGVDSVPGGITIQVTPEDAVALWDSDNPVAAQVDSPGGDSGEFFLIANIEELVPDADTVAMPLPGDIGEAVVTITLAPIGPGPSYNVTCVAQNDPPPYVYRADSGFLTVQCAFDDVSVNTYHALLEVGSDHAGVYYRGSAEDVLTIFDPSLGFTTGGGFFYWPGTQERTNFGFTMKYNKKGKRVQGSLLVIRHFGGGMIARLKSNAIEGLAVGDGSGFEWASFAGKATFQRQSWAEPIGNFQFLAYTEDYGEPGAGADRFWVQVTKDRASEAELSLPDEAPLSAETIVGGNIVVPHRTGK